MTWEKQNGVWGEVMVELLDGAVQLYGAALEYRATVDWGDGEDPAVADRLMAEGFDQFVEAQKAWKEVFGSFLRVLEEEGRTAFDGFCDADLVHLVPKLLMKVQQHVTDAEGVVELREQFSAIVSAMEEGGSDGGG